MKRKPKRNNSLRLTIWYWFMAYVLLTFLLLWVFQGVFLQKFYDSMKTRDVIRLSDQLVEIYQNDPYWYDAFVEQEYEHGVCFQAQ